MVPVVRELQAASGSCGLSKLRHYAGFMGVAELSEPFMPTECCRKGISAQLGHPLGGLHTLPFPAWKWGGPSQYGSPTMDTIRTWNVACMKEDCVHLMD